MLEARCAQQTASTHAQHVFHVNAKHAAFCNPHVGLVLSDTPEDPHAVCFVNCSSRRPKSDLHSAL